MANKTTKKRKRISTAIDAKRQVFQEIIERSRGPEDPQELMEEIVRALDMSPHILEERNSPLESIPPLVQRKISRELTIAERHQLRLLIIASLQRDMKSELGF